MWHIKIAALWCINAPLWQLNRRNIPIHRYTTIAVYISMSLSNCGCIVIISPGFEFGNVEAESFEVVNSCLFLLKRVH